MNSGHLFLLLKRQWLENRRSWLVGALAIMAIITFLFLLITHWRTSFNGDTVNGVFLLMLFGGGSVFISAIFKDLGNKQKGIWFLILPASAAEKLIVALFYGLVAYLIVYLGLFYSVQAIIRLILGNDASGLAPVNLLKNNFYHFIFTFINIQSIVLLGSVYFNKNQFLKTLLLIIGGGFIVFNANALLLKYITNENTITSTIPLDSFQFVYRAENIYVHATTNTEFIVSVILWVIVPVTLWFITWYKIKEKEL